MTSTKHKSLYPKKELNDVLVELKKDIFSSMNCIKIGTIQSFDETTQTASVQLSIKKVLEEKPDGTKVVADISILEDVPCFIIGGGGASLQFPIKKDDICLVLFNDNDIDNWFAGNNGASNTYRMHDLSDGFAFVGFGNLITAIADYISGIVRLQLNSTNKMEISSGQFDFTTALAKFSGKIEATGQIKSAGEVEGATVKADNGATATVAINEGGVLSHSITVVNGIVTAIS